MKPNFQAMTRVELRTYLLKHRDDQEAFHAYMDKLAKEPVLAVHSPSDPNTSQVLMRSPQPPLKRGAIFFPLFKGD